MYRIPDWSKPPNDSLSKEEKGIGWTLDEIKGGVIVQTYNLNDASCITFGRAAEVEGAMTITTAHESCSRLHARIAFDKSGIPWLKDLQSGNGTTVNKRSLPKVSISKLEVTSSSPEGARGVMVYPGDVLKFGVSTRFFVLNGPPEFERGALEARAIQKKLNSKLNGGANTTTTNAPTINNKSGEVQEEDKGGGGVSWGIAMDDEEEEDVKDDTRERPSSTVNPFMGNTDPNSTNMDIPPKHRKLQEKIRVKQYKLSNIQTESDRIQSKASMGELSSGQEAQLEKNRIKGEKLMEEIKQMEDELWDKINSKSNSSKKRKKRRRDGSEEYDDVMAEEDVDDFYDRTSSHQGNGGDSGYGNNNPAETEESLIKKWKSHVSKLQYQEQRLQLEQRQVKEIEDEIQLMKRQNEDVQDLFFRQNSLDIARETLKGVHDEKISLEKELDSIEGLLVVVNNKLVWDRKLHFVGAQTQLDELYNKEKQTSIDNTTDFGGEDHSMPPPPPPPKIRSKKIPPPKKNEHMDMPPPPPSIPTRQMQGPKQSNDDHQSNEVSEKSEMNPPPPVVNKMQAPRSRVVRGPMRPPQGTLSMLNMASSSMSQNIASDNGTKRKQTQSGEKEAPNKKQNTDRSNENIFNSRKDEWVAPQGQDGSGKTKLNAKFEGRY